MAHYWTDADLEAALAGQGYVVGIGQISPAMKRQLDRRAKAGELVKFRGFWNNPFGSMGIGPLKSIWALPTAEQLPA